MRQLSILLFIFLLVSTFLPSSVFATNVFGGQASQVIPCHNNVIWTLIGPPRGGRYIWAPGITRTYEYGYPRHAGQWFLGLYGAPYFCIVSVSPIIIFPGNFMMMMGSSR